MRFSLDMGIGWIGHGGERLPRSAPAPARTARAGPQADVPAGWVWGSEGMGSGADRASPVDRTERAGQLTRDAAQVGKRDAGWRQCVADALFEIGVSLVQHRLQLRGCAEV